MQFLTSIVAMIAMVSSAQACKCVSSVGNNVPATRQCCGELGGSLNGADCPANQISSRLSTFAACCSGYGTRSDCRCPFGCARAELQAKAKTEGKAPPTDEEVRSYVASYEE